MICETPVGNLFVEIVGKGTPVVLWHSFLCDGNMWKPQLLGLRDAFRFINIDGPGHGRSGQAPIPYSLDDCGRAVLTVMDALNVQEAAYAGLSWGGMVGMRLAVSHPERISRVALLDTSARPETPVSRFRYGAMLRLIERVWPFEPLIQYSARKMFCDATLDSRPDLVERYRSHVAALSPSAIRSAAKCVFDRQDFTSELAKLKIPALIIHGELDRGLPIAQGEHLKRHLPDARFVRIPRAGHLVTLEQAERVNAEFRSFFSNA